MGDRTLRMLARFKALLDKQKEILEMRKTPKVIGIHFRANLKAKKK